MAARGPWSGSGGSTYGAGAPARLLPGQCNNPEIRGGSQTKCTPKPPPGSALPPPFMHLYRLVFSKSRCLWPSLSDLFFGPFGLLVLLEGLYSPLKSKKSLGRGRSPPAPPPPPLRDGCAAARRTGWAAPNPQSNGHFEAKPQSNGHFDIFGSLPDLRVVAWVSRLIVQSRWRYEQEKGKKGRKEGKKGREERKGRKSYSRGRNLL